MSESTKKTKRQRAKRIVFITAIALGVAVFFSMAFAAYKARENFSEDAYMAMDASIPEETPNETVSSTKAPSPTPRKPFIPDPDDLQTLPDVEDIDIDSDVMDGEFDEDEILNLTWDIVDDADYYVFCAKNSEDKTYHQEILWSDISEWFIPDVQAGCVYLFCYEDMGEDSAEDDKLIAAFSYSIEIEEDEDPEPSPTKKPSEEDDDEVQNKYYIIVDKEDFTFAAFTYDENGEYTKLVVAFPTAIGRSNRMTPNGSFEISSKGAWKTWSSGSFSPFYTRFTSGLYFHGAVYEEQQGGTMYKSYYEGIGSAASSGCLRTTFEAAKWVYYNCPAGTVVEIVDSSDKVNKVIKPPLDPAYPRWDPTDPDKPSLDPPAIVTNTVLVMDEGTSSALTDSLSAVDENVENDTLLYEVVTGPQNGTLNKETFTQAEINDGTIVYTHDGSETETDSFKFTVSNKSSKTGTMTFHIKINLLDDTMPVIEINEWITIDQGANHSLSSALLASDEETDSNDLVYTVTTMPEHGSVPTSFTQAELLAGEVVYIHDGSDSASDSFMFSVSDGTNVLEDQMFTISINLTEPAETASAEPTEEPTPEPSAAITAEPTESPSPTPAETTS